jgi:hypothetical protein
MGAEVELSPGKAARDIDLFVNQVETSPSLEHRGLLAGAAGA